MKNNFTNQASLILSNSFTSNHFILKATLISFFFLFISTSFAVSNQTITVRLVDENGNILANYPSSSTRMSYKYRCGGGWQSSVNQQTNSNGEFDIAINCTSNNWDGKLSITLFNTTQELTFSSNPFIFTTARVNVNIKNSCTGLVTSPGSDVQINYSGWPTIGNTNGVGTLSWQGFANKSQTLRLASFNGVTQVSKTVTLSSGVNEIDYLTSSVSVNGASVRYPNANSTPFSSTFNFLHGTYPFHLYTGTTYRGIHNINVSGCQTTYYPLLSSNSGVTITQNDGLYDENGLIVKEDAIDKTWKVTPTSNLSNVSLTFQWDANSELTGFDETLLGLYTRTSGYTGAGDWTLVNSGSASLSGSVYSYTVTGLTLNAGIDYYYGITNSNMTPLPVSIIDFKGFVKNDIINLNWKVTDEKELSRYEIYSSVDGSNYSVCGSVSATVSEIGVKTYQFQDLSNKSALVYYKIKAINNDETGEWTSIVALHTTKPVVNKPLKVYPNPATDFINLEFEGIVPSYFNVLIMDMSGKVVYQLDGVESESNQYTLPLNGIESGMYIVKLSDEFGNTTINRFNIK